MSKKAIIQNGKVVNIIEFIGNPVTLKLPTGQITWDCGQYAVAIGDDFADGVFSREGAALEVQQTAEQIQLSELTELVDSMLIDQLTAEGAIVSE